jgi:hypothetical protein
MKSPTRQLAGNALQKGGKATKKAIAKCTFLNTFFLKIS